MAITNEQLTEYLSSLGVSLPSAIVDGVVAKVNTAEACMIGAGYTASDIEMALLIAGGLVSISMGARVVKSQKADVVSQSYEYSSIDELQSMLENNLSLFDPSGCTNSVIPSNVNPSFLLAGVAQYNN